MVFEILIDLAYIAAVVLLVAGIERTFEPSSFSGPEFINSGTAGLWGAFFIVAVGMVVLVGALPPVVAHQLAHNGWRLNSHPHDYSLIHIGLIGNVAQLVGAGGALYILFRATWLALGLYGAFFYFFPR